MKLHELKPPRGARKRPKRVGRGPGSGHGTYSGRGLKGQKARMAGKPPRGFEGGQMPLQRRVPKRGFTNVHKVVAQPVNLADLERRPDRAEFTLEIFYELGLASRNKGPVKVLARGAIGRAVRVQAHRFSRAARQAIEAAGGSVEALETPRRRRRTRKEGPATAAGRNAGG
jgi:large subunit ribosomal protein L15